MKKSLSVSWKNSPKSTAKKPKLIKSNSLNTSILNNNEIINSWLECPKNEDSLSAIFPPSEDSDANVDEMLSSILDLDGEIFSEDKNPMYSFVITDILVLDDSIKLIGDKYSCTVKDDWKDINFKVGMTVKIVHCFCCCKGIGHVDFKNCTVDKNNFYILIDDEPISITSFCSAFKCIYSSLFSQSISDISFEYSHPSLVIGIIAHFVLQKSLKTQNYSLNFMLENANKSISNNIPLLYASNIDETKALKEITCFLKQLIAFSKNRFKAVDIEKRIFSNLFNFKGIIDAVLQIGNELVPLEIKSGKNMEISHKAQVYLYFLIMKEKNFNMSNVSYLFYISNGTLMKLKPKHEEIRSILVLRNKISSIKFENSILPTGFCDSNIFNSNSDAEISSTEPKSDLLNSIELSSIRVASPVSKSTNTHTQAHTKAHTETHNEIYTNPFGDISDFHPNCNCSDTQFCKKLQKIFSDTREENIFMKTQWTAINTEESHQKTEKLHHFIFVSQNKNILTIRSPSIPDYLKDGYITVFDSQKRKICNGLLIHSEDQKLTIKVFENVKFHDFVEIYISIGRNDLLYKTLRFSLMNLVYDEKLKNLLFNFEPSISLDYRDSSSQTKLPSTPQTTIAIPECYRREFLALNTSQRNALYQSLNCENYKIIHGMPGTGKSTVIALLIKILVKLNKKVLLVCYTNLALENIFKKIKSINFYRVRQEDTFTSVEKMKMFYSAVECVAGTCYSFKHPIFLNRHFDFCIVDEASQQHLLLTLIPVSLASRFVLVGDHLQLQPLTHRSKVLSTSLFEYLLKRSTPVELNIQYRMGPQIMKLSNHLFYSNRMLSGCTKASRIEFIDTRFIALQKVLHSKNEAFKGNFVVLCYFNSQVQIVKQYVQCSVETVDRYQGSEHENVVLVFEPFKENDVVRSRERLNVALTRAKSTLSVVGNRERMKRIPILRDMLLLIGG